MYERAPVPPAQNTDITEPLTPIEQKVINRLELRRKWGLATKIGSVAMMLATTTGTHIYLEDALANKALAEETHVSIATILPDDSNAMSVYNGGYNTDNGDLVAKKLGPAVQQIHPGSLESIRLGEGAPSSTEIARSIIEYAHANKQTEVTLFGYSLGGLEIIKSAAQIIQENNITIKAIYLASTPAGLDSLQPDKIEQINALTPILAAIPYSEHSKYVQFALALGSISDRFIKGDNLIDLAGSFNLEAFNRAWDTAADIVESKKTPRAGILEYQIKLAKTDIKREFQAIANAADKQPLPTIIYLRIPNDTTVKPEAAEQICNDAHEVLIPCIIIDVESSHHDGYWTDESVVAYTNTIRDHAGEIESTMKIQELVYAMQVEQKQLSKQLAEASSRLDSDPLSEK